MKTFRQLAEEQNKKCTGCRFNKNYACIINSEWYAYRNKDVFSNQSYPNGIDISEQLPCYRK